MFTMLFNLNVDLYGYSTTMSMILKCILYFDSFFFNPARRQTMNDSYYSQDNVTEY